MADTKSQEYASILVKNLGHNVTPDEIIQLLGLDRTELLMTTTKLRITEEEEEVTARIEILQQFQEELLR